MSHADHLSDSADTDEITSVECFDCVVPLPQPVRVGTTVVAARSYVIVRLRTRRGAEGVGYAFGRGLPVARIVTEALGPALMGADTRLPESVRERIAGAFWSYAEQGLLPVALSAIDLALWDMLGRRAGMPLADILGRRSASVDVCLIGGYTKVGDDGLGALEAEMAGFTALGARAVKLTVGAASPRQDGERLRLVRRVIGDDVSIAVDAFRSFRSLDEALQRIRFLEPHGVAYLEDPFTESLAPLLADLRRRTSIPIAAGENLSGHRAYRALIDSDAVDVVRCDATVVGGTREFMAVVALASARGLQVACHVHPEIHVHFASACGNLHPAGLELMLPSTGLDGLHRLLRTQLEVVDGAVRVPDGPGLGLDFDWTAVQQYARP